MEYWIRRVLRNGEKCDGIFYSDNISYLSFRVSKIIGITLTLAVLAINMYFAAVSITNLSVKHWALYTLIGLIIALYLLFILYLVGKLAFQG